MENVSICVLNRVANLYVQYKKCFNCKEEYNYMVSVYENFRAAEIIIKCLKCDRIKYYELNYCEKYEGSTQVSLSPD